jgi:iron(III) transport system substrate-binding protein
MLTKEETAIMRRHSEFCSTDSRNIPSGFPSYSTSRAGKTPSRAARPIKLALCALTAAATLALSLAAPAAMAQSAAVAAVANYKGADRDQKILAAAKKEGKVSMYTSLEDADASKIKAAFEKKYGIKLELWRAGSETILQRVMTETRANHYSVDVIETNGMELEALQQENMEQPFQSPYLADLIPEATKPSRQWIATRMHLYCVGYNTNAVKKEDLPKTYKDLLNPMWKGKIGIEATNYAWFATVVQALGENDGLQLFKDIVKTNGISVRKGHNLLVNLVASGEVPMALTVNSQAIAKLKKTGAPVGCFFLQFGIGMMNGMALHRDAPHPNAAALLMDFMLTDGQTVLHDLGREATAKKYQAPPEGKIIMVDSAGLLAQSAKWEKLYQDIVVAPQ